MRELKLPAFSYLPVFDPIFIAVVKEKSTVGNGRVRPIITGVIKTHQGLLTVSFGNTLVSTTSLAIDQCLPDGSISNRDWSSTMVQTKPSTALR